jgi:site-specific DNA-methyltransferase (adenine-specific)
MTPYYQDSHCVIWNADCREVLPTLGGVDLVLTDPPYDFEAHTCQRRTRAVIEGRKADDSIPFAQISTEDYIALLSIQCNWLVAFCQAEMVATYRDLLGDSYRRAMVWIKPDSAPQFTGDRPAMGYESIVCAWRAAGKSKWNSGGKRGVYTYLQGHSRTSGHPTEKPLGLITELAGDFSLGGLVLDPFMGSGTTLIAAKQLGLKVIGIEKEERWCAAAAKRLSQEYLPLTQPTAHPSEQLTLNTNE